MQNCVMFPHFVAWAESLSAEAVGKTFFWSSPDFGQENGLGFGLENFHSGLFNSQIPAPPPPPPFENPAYATGYFTKQVKNC